MVYIKTKEEIAVMREGGKILARILHNLAKEIEPGATTGYLEELAFKWITEAGGKPAFKGYKQGAGAKGFPTSICTSINNEVVHGPALPSRKLDEGDLISIDIGMEYPACAKAPARSRPEWPGRSAGKPLMVTTAPNPPRNKYSKDGGFITDMALTAGVGKIGKEQEKLLKATREALELGIRQVRPNNRLSDIGRAIETHVSRHGFSVVRQLVGHGVGYEVHEDPQIPNFVPREKGFKDLILKPGMVIAIEPMVNAGRFEVEGEADGFTIYTKDGSLSAHFEHTVAVTEKGFEILTLL
ncbi:MAG: type I methionyl aminopeptidase [Patescibacteria group bacterium]|jgi:methionyl aminopeptidase